ncbi:MAG: bifunctional UDP-3-O-[3-hydroxymyristoyl] N-acetylglucosamine deacetylase/3-hydroxyacyl-ACP dehydratase [candidate division Zixibacteria bacterium]|nr:bifunctional UDP-3-O-[3-hydroxymyristoyl] N-acetylglucosamine deacetylase/3-hydroxyacyl-ACP dehydratase [candidate division Zixibacteria bacterium]
MNKHQRTIQRSAELTGTGLHTGVACTIRFNPAPVGTGVVFRVPGGKATVDLKADIDLVIDVNRGTTIAQGDAKVHTVEHVLSALAGLEIDNCICELDNIEPPIGDGSSKPFVDVLLGAGVQSQDEPKIYFEPDAPINYSEPARGVDLICLPSEDFRVTFMVDYKNPALGTQYTTLASLEAEYATDFAPARTFCFLSEVEALFKQGLIRGGRLDNAVVICDDGYTEKDAERLRLLIGYPRPVSIGKTGILDDIPLRFPNEPVRHKVLDLIGDLSLVGVPIKAHILAARSGHAANVGLARKIRAEMDKKRLAEKYKAPAIGKGLQLDSQAIAQIMPHRYPMLLIDRVLNLEPGKRVTAIKNVTFNEPYFAGHFPQHPVMPGVLIVEAMAQAGGLMLLNMIENPQEMVVYFMGIDNARFRRPVRPGDQLRFEVEMLQSRRGMWKIAGKAYVDDALVTEATMMAMLMEK